jgi:hypothetical protein
MLLVASKVASPERGGKILGCSRQNRPTRFSHSAGSSSLSFAQTHVSKSGPFGGSVWTTSLSSSLNRATQWATSSNVGDEDIVINQVLHALLRRASR